MPVKLVLAAFALGVTLVVAQAAGAQSPAPAHAAHGRVKPVRSHKTIHHRRPARHDASAGSLASRFERPYFLLSAVASEA
jgi:hypothetical protein